MLTKLTMYGLCLHHETDSCHVFKANVVIGKKTILYHGQDTLSISDAVNRVFYQLVKLVIVKFYMCNSVSLRLTNAIEISFFTSKLSLTTLLQSVVWHEEAVPRQWREGLIVNLFIERIQGTIHC